MSSVQPRTSPLSKNGSSQKFFFLSAFVFSSVIHASLFFGIRSDAFKTKDIHPGFQQGKLVINNMGSYTSPPPVESFTDNQGSKKSPPARDASTPSTPGVQTFEESVLNPNLVPEYPRMAIKMGHVGFVRLKFEIDPQGHVSNVFVVEEKAHQLLKDSALKAAKQWKFRPSKDGHSYTVEKRVVFQIN